MSSPPLPPPYNDHNKTFPQDTNSIFSTPRWPSSRQTTATATNSSLSCSPSFSSSSSATHLSSSSSDDSPPPSPSITLPQFSDRIPFSWETHPGIPKKQIQAKAESSRNTSNSKTSRSLPLPPASTPQSKPYHRRKPNAGGSQSVRRDPFFTALVECSKEDNGKQPTRATRAINDRFGLGLMVNLNAYSCKRTCSVSESIVFLPRSRKALGYEAVNNKP